MTLGTAFYEALLGAAAAKAFADLLDGTQPQPEAGGYDHTYEFHPEVVPSNLKPETVYQGRFDTLTRTVEQVDDHYEVRWVLVETC